jgi:hypothetical protein
MAACTAASHVIKLGASLLLGSSMLMLCLATAAAPPRHLLRAANIACLSFQDQGA